MPQDGRQRSSSAFHPKVLTALTKPRKTSRLRTAKWVQPVKLKLLMERELLLFENFQFFGKVRFCPYAKTLGRKLKVVSKNKRWPLRKFFGVFFWMLLVYLYGVYHKSSWNWLFWIFLKLYPWSCDISISACSKIAFNCLESFFEGVSNVLLKKLCLVVMWVECAKYGMLVKSSYGECGLSFCFY